MIVLCGNVLVADPQGPAAVPELITEHWDSISWIFEPNGTAALTQVRLERPDLVIVNLQLPDMCGAELVERIRKGRPMQKLVVTSDVAGVLPEKVARSLGVTAYFAKPVSPNLYDSLLRQLLGTMVGFAGR